MLPQITTKVSFFAMYRTFIMFHFENKRLRIIDDQKWLAKVLRYLYMKSVGMEWRKRTRSLSKKYMKPGSAREMTKTINRRQ